MSTIRRRAGLVAAFALTATASLSAIPARADDRVAQGEKLFKDQGCPQCHGFGGKGDGYLLKMIKEPVQMHDWTSPDTLKGLSDTYLFDITKQGGEPLGKSKVMLSYGHKLSDDEIRTIIVYIRSVATPAP
jgi:mono/diheme cytochrome c family protein